MTVYIRELENLVAVQSKKLEASKQITNDSVQGQSPGSFLES